MLGRIVVEDDVIPPCCKGVDRISDVFVNAAFIAKAGVVESWGCKNCVRG